MINQIQFPFKNTPKSNTGLLFKVLLGLSIATLLVVSINHLKRTTNVSEK